MTLKRVLAICAVALTLCAPGLAQTAPYVNLTGVLQSSNGMPASNYILSFQPSQFGFVAGGSVVVNAGTYCATSTDGSVVGVPNPLQKPPVTAGFTGTLPPANYYVKIAFYDASGNVTLASPETVVQLNATGRLTVMPPTQGMPAGASGMRVYISPSPGAETLQGQSTSSGAYIQSVPLVSGGAPAATNATICKQVANDAIIPTGTGYTVAMTDPNGNTIPGYPMQWQLMGAGTTINLSNGLPYYHGTVFFPSPIVASPPNHGLQSIAGPLDLDGYNLSNVGNLQVDGLDGCLHVGGVLYPTVASALTAAGTYGCIVIPANSNAPDLATYTNPTGTLVLNYNLGTPTSPADGLSYDRNNLFMWRSDKSGAQGAGDTCCNGQAPSGVGDAAPMVGFHLDSYGSSTVLPLYSVSNWMPGATGFQGGFSLNANALVGSAPQQVFNNILLSDSSGWDINSCTLVSGIDTCTTVQPIVAGTLNVGAAIYANGNSSADTGGGVGIVQSVSTNTIVFQNQNASGSAPAAPGGHIGTQHLAWVTEFNGFNNNHDPGPVTPTTGQVLLPFHGVTSTSIGTYPISEGFWADGNFYEGFLCDDASDGCFVAGRPNVGGGRLLMSAGFIARPQCVGTSGANCASVLLKFVDSTYDATTSFRERPFTIAYGPISNAADAAGQLIFTTVVATGTLSDNLGFSLPSGSASATTYGFSNGVDGMFLDTGGNVGLSVNGFESVTITPQGAKTAMVIPTATTAPTGSCSSVPNGTIEPSLDGHMTSCSAGTWVSRW